MKSLPSLLCCLLLALCAVVPAVGCWVPELPDETLFVCDPAADCAEEGVVCAPRTGLRGYCCKATLEVCNGLDDDCDGQKDDLADSPCYGGPAGTLGKGICKAGKPSCNTKGEVVCTGDVRPGTEACNGLDDNCDGAADEGFNLQTDMANCGQCGNACGTGFACVDGSCKKRSELDCNNGVDDDEDGKKDCEDLADCSGQSCGPNCICIGGKRGEAVCSNGDDDDGDGTNDCIDSDCDGKECNATVGGCTCKDLGKSESASACGDGKDNDSDGLTDCADTQDCDTKSCGTGCVCTGNKGVETVCNDNLDNDNNQGIDCADADCNLKDCSVLGGCICRAGQPFESDCGDGQDNDGDKKADCADTDCAYKNFGDGTRCYGGNRVEFNCGDNSDNDGDGDKDCADTDCAGLVASSTAGTICSVSTRGTFDEYLCTDNKDNDSDGKTDCKTTGGSTQDPNCNSGTGSCGFGCVINTCTTKKESVCDDLADNDGDGKTDCADTTDCPANTVCRKADGTVGKCSSNACN